MSNEAVDNYSDALGSVPDCYRIQNMWSKAVSTFTSTVQFVPDNFKTEEMSDEAVNTWILPKVRNEL